MTEPALLGALADATAAANLRLDQRFAGSMNSNDIDGVMACFLNSSDLTVVLYGTTLRGPQALRQFLTQMFAGVRSVNLEVLEITRWILGDTVFAAGVATYEFEALDGTKSVLKECWTDARQEVRGQWVYVLDHATQIPDERTDSRHRVSSHGLVMPKTSPV